MQAWIRALALALLASSPVAVLDAGDPCSDLDADGICDADDNCAAVANPVQGPVLRLSDSLTGPSFTAPMSEPAVDPFSPDGATFVYKGSDATTAGLFSVPVTGGSVARITPPFDPGQSVLRYHVTPGGQYVAYDVGAGLYSVPLAGGAAVPLDGGLAMTSFFGPRWLPSPDGLHVVFTSSELGQMLAYRVPLTGGAPTQLAGPGSVVYWAHSTVDSSAFFGLDLSATPFEVDLYRADGNGTQLLADPDEDVYYFDVTPDGSHVIYHTAFSVGSGSLDSLYAVPATGGPSVRLNPEGSRVADTRDWVCCPTAVDGARVVFIAEEDGETRLYSALVADGSATRLDEDGHVHDLVVSAAGDRVAFESQAPGAATALAVTPIDEAAPVPVEPGSSLQDSWIVETFDGTGERIVFHTDAEISGVREVFSAPRDGGAAARISAPLTAGGSVSGITAAPVGDWIVYKADGEVVDRTEAYAVRSVGGPVLRLTSDLGATEDVATVGISPTGERVVFRIVSPDPARNQLFAAPLSELGLDADGDGAGRACDCDDGDPLFGPEINDGLDNTCTGSAGHGLTDELSGPIGFYTPGDDGRLAWPGQPGATLYDVARADHPKLLVGCVPLATSEAFVDDADVPAPGAAFFYVVRASAPHVGSWGAGSSGAERTPACF